jgi:anti-sigma regulatory factor (Ser/Thr protein kinase)
MRPVSATGANAFRHEALLYAGIDEFMAAAVSFLREGAAAGEAAMVAVDERKIRMLQEALGPDAETVSFVEMHGLGRNPARIIPAWRDFVSEHAGSGRGLRGIGEPVWAGRSAAEMTECECHESLLNRAFDGGPGWQLMCPYDTAALTPAAVQVAGRTHPFVTENGVTRRSPDYAEEDALAAPLPGPPADADEIEFTEEDLVGLRWVVSNGADRAGLGGRRVGDLVLAVHELAANSLRHGGGHGVLRMWEDRDAFVCEVRDEGRIEEPLVGRALPAPEQTGGHGLWLVNQVCDLVQLRSSPSGSVVRVRMSTAA